MSSVPPITTSEAASTDPDVPVDTFVLRPNHQPPSILDTVFVSKRSKRAVYATTTDANHKTCLWKVRRDGQLELVASIGWECSVQTSNAIGQDSLGNMSGQVKNVVMVNYGGRAMQAGEFLRKGTGWLHSNSKAFSVDKIEYKWKSGNGIVNTHDGVDSHHQSLFCNDMWKIWRCVVASPGISNAHPHPRMARVNSGIGDHAMSRALTDESICNERCAEPPRNMGDPPLSTGYPSPLANLSLSSPLTRSTADSGTKIGPNPYRKSSESFGAPIPPSTSKARGMISLLFFPAPSTLLARFVPPQVGLIHHELALFSPLYASIPVPSSSPYASRGDIESNTKLLENLLVSAILLVTGKGEWRQVKSLADPDALQAVFMAEARGDLPPYTSRVGRIRPPHMAFRSDASRMNRSREPESVQRPRTT
ncbi:hypothetical protein PIIN_08837 [Serendipita indica DSM 11827]|uniref:Uncharacterized protein n=1 Tax=Serendipita indica (strain DSM 11827) TaxID=1109443 RepID=G4TU74_SERID|nr:hypothetical protein PIIN_08837 [Serendipita indica DSM 11827]